MKNGNNYGYNIDMKIHVLMGRELKVNRIEGDYLWGISLFHIPMFIIVKILFVLCMYYYHYITYNL